MLEHSTNIAQTARDYLIDLIEQIDMNNYEGKGEMYERIKVDDVGQLDFYRTKQQHGGALCGFHCLFNIVNFISYRKTGDLFYLRKMNSFFQFWRFYSEVLRYLIDEGNLEDSAKKTLMDSGPLERYQFDFLLKNHPTIKETVKDEEGLVINFMPFFYAFGHIQGMTKTDLVNFQNNLNNLKSYKEGKKLIYVVLLGVTNHWSVLIIEKEFQQDKQPEFKFSYLDSNNNKVFHLSQTEQSAFLYGNQQNVMGLPQQDDLENYSKDYFVNVAKYRQPPNEWLQKCFTQWLSDINAVIRYFYKFINDDTTVFDLVVEKLALRVVHTFEQYNKIDLNEKIEVGGKVQNLLDWLTNEYHPRILEVDLCNSVEMFDYSNRLKELAVHKKLIGIIQYSNLLLQNDERKNLPNSEILMRYTLVLDKLKLLID